MVKSISSPGDELEVDYGKNGARMDRNDGNHVDGDAVVHVFRRWWIRKTYYIILNHLFNLVFDVV